MPAIIQILILLLGPGLILWLCKKLELLNLIGPIVLSYIVGLIIANFSFISFDSGLSNFAIQATVPLAIVLMLFPTDIKGWLQHAGSAITSFGLLIVAVTISSTTIFLLAGYYIPEAKNIAGMLIGVYTGGTPNMAAIGLSLGVNNETFVLLNSVDVIVSGLYFLFLITVAQRLLQTFLPAFDQLDYINLQTSDGSSNQLESTFWGYLRCYLLPLIPAIMLVAAGIGLSYLLIGDITEVAAILIVTTLGLGASFIPRIRNLKGSYPTGEYILMIFCIAVGSLSNFEQMMQSSIPILVTVGSVCFLSIMLHFLLATFFDIDTDTVLITSTAGIFGPAFVPVIAKALDNKEIIVSGLTTGLIGYAIGTYWGIAVAYLLQSFF